MAKLVVDGSFDRVVWEVHAVFAEDNTDGINWDTRITGIATRQSNTVDSSVVLLVIGVPAGVQVSQCRIDVDSLFVVRVEIGHVVRRTTTTVADDLRSLPRDVEFGV